MGYRRGPHIEIVDVTTPMLFDVRKRCSFERKDLGHQRICDSRWESSGGTMHYIGEWHTHPEMRPTPSSIDRREWGKLKNYYCEPLVFIITGTNEWYIEFLSCKWLIVAPG